MEQHPIPRQITTFEFKLIGFLTIKQFIYLVFFIPLGLLTYFIFPIPFLNILLSILIALFGVALAFLPINDRPLDVWIKNLYKRLTSPTQYFYNKQNPPIYFLRNLSFEINPYQSLIHIRSQQLLNKYLETKNENIIKPNDKKQTINQLLQQSLKLNPNTNKKNTKDNKTTKPSFDINSSYTTVKKPFFSGVVKNHKLIPLPGILIYVKNDKGEVLRLLKTNPHGIFATFNPLPLGEYTFEVKDPKSTYNFDKMKIRIDSKNQKPIEIFSKELL